MLVNECTKRRETSSYMEKFGGIITVSYIKPVEEQSTFSDDFRFKGIIKPKNHLVNARKYKYVMHLQL